MSSPRHNQDRREGAPSLRCRASACWLLVPGGYIEAQEAEGQRQLVGSDVLPSRILHGEQADYEALGFVFGDPVEGDPLFRYVTLPKGWRKEGSDHDMWSYVVDEAGQRRVGVFYKAAFYDRKAHMSMAQV